MSAPKFQRLLIPVALWFSATLCIAVGTQLAWSQEEAPQSPGTGQGLLSRFRGGTPKPKDSADESMQDRNWKGGLRVPLQGFNPIQNFTPPWKSKTDPTQTTTPAPIDLQRTFKPSKEPFGPRTNALPRSDFGVDPTATNPTATNPAIINPNATRNKQPDPIPSASAERVGSGLASSAPRAQTPPKKSEPAITSPANDPQVPADRGSESSRDLSNRKELKTYEATPKVDIADVKKTSRRKPPTPPTENPTRSSEPAQPNSDSGIPSNKEDLSRVDSHSALPPPMRLSNGEPISSRVPALLTTNTKPSIQPEQSTPVDVRVPQLRLRVDGPQSIPVGQTAAYTVHATNEGTSPLEGLIVRASVPKGVKIDGVQTMVGTHEMDESKQDVGVLWELQSLAANDSKSMELHLIVSDAERFALNLEWSVAPSPTQMEVQVQQPKLELALEGSSTTEIGVPQQYRMRIKNPGSAELKDLTLQLQTETTGQYESNVGSLPAGAEKLVEIELTFDQPGLFPIVATAKSLASKLEQRQRIDVQVQKVALNAKWFGPSEFIQGSTAEYELLIENAGAVPAKQIDCSVALPPGLEIQALPQGIQQQGNLLRWTIDSLDAQEQFVLPLQCAMTTAGQQEFSFLAKFGRGGVAQCQLSTRVDAVADLQLEVIEPQAPAPVGHPVVYEIRLSNQGSKAAENVMVIAQFSDGIEPQAVEGHAGRTVPGQALFNTLDRIEPNQSRTLKVICQAAKGGTHRFRIAIQCPGSEEELLEEGSTRFVAGSVKPTKR